MSNKISRTSLHNIKQLSYRHIKYDKYRFSFLSNWNEKIHKMRFLQFYVNISSLCLIRILQYFRETIKINFLSALTPLPY